MALADSKTVTEIDKLVQDATEEVLRLHLQLRPENTRKAYEPKQREWRVSSFTLYSY